MTFGIGDLVSIGTAILFLAFGMLRPVNRHPDRIVLCLANGLAFGTMMLVLLSPIFQLAGLKANLLDIAVREEKLALRWAAAVAAVNLVWTLL